MPDLYDVSVSIRAGMATWPGHPQPGIEPVWQLATGDGANVSRAWLGTHTGTHVDPPCHFVLAGPTADMLPLDSLIGRALVVELGIDHTITAYHLERARLPGKAERIIFKTRNSYLWGQPGFQADFVGLSPDAAEYLVREHVRLVGIDYLSIERFDGDGSTHRTLLEAGIPIVEGLDLRGVEAGEYDLVVLPLELANADGGPARAVLIR